MRAIIINQYGATDVLQLTQFKKPTPRPDEVSVRIHAVAVNPADAKWRSGMFKDILPVSFPHILGYDIAGVVDTVGDNVADLQVGDRVTGMLNPMTKGGYAEYACTQAKTLAKIPDTVDFITAAALPTAGLTGVQLVENHIQPLKGQRLLITGTCGAVGRFAMHTARKAGVYVVAAVKDSQLDLAKSLGADEVLTISDTTWNGEAFDHVADTIGGSDVARLCNHLKPGGKIRSVATTPIPYGATDTIVEFIQVIPEREKLEILLSDIASGVLNVPIAKTLPLKEASHAHKLLETGRLGGKIVLLI